MTEKVLHSKGSDFVRVLEACNLNNLDPFAFAIVAIAARMDFLQLSTMTIVKTTDAQGIEKIEVHGSKASEVETVEVFPVHATA